ncbi:MAG: site-2 protease family protein [Chloroflexota bacterium]
MFDFSLSQILASAVILLVAFPAHELAHALTADYFGDDTPRLQGRLTLNPLAHLDLFGSLLLLVAGFGWAKPVQVNPYILAQRSKSAPAIVALAGPVTNFFLGILGAIPLWLGIVPLPAGDLNKLSLFMFLYFFAFINFILFFFNLIPLFPLDGEKVLFQFAGPELQRRLMKFRTYQFIPLLIILWVLPRFGIPVIDWLVFNPAIRLINLFGG